MIINIPLSIQDTNNEFPDYLTTTYDVQPKKKKKPKQWKGGENKTISNPKK